MKDVSFVIVPHSGISNFLHWALAHPTTITGDTHEFGPLTFSIMSSSTSSSSLSLSLSRRWYGTRLIGWALGCTSGSIGILS